MYLAPHPSPPGKKKHVHRPIPGRCRPGIGGRASASSSDGARRLGLRSNFELELQVERARGRPGQRAQNTAATELRPWLPAAGPGCGRCQCRKDMMTLAGRLGRPRRPAARGGGGRHGHSPCHVLGGSDGPTTGRAPHSRPGPNRASASLSKPGV